MEEKKKGGRGKDRDNHGHNSGKRSVPTIDIRKTAVRGLSQEPGALREGTFHLQETEGQTPHIL